jgi:hypothetical protein
MKITQLMRWAAGHLSPLGEGGFERMVLLLEFFSELQGNAQGQK